MNDTLIKVKSLTSSFTVRLFLIGFLILILMIPLVMISFLIYEREERYHDAQSEIASKWGADQTIIGPIMRVPLQFTQSGITKTEFLNVFPETMKIEAVVTPETRSRGIFDILLYSAQIKITGTFPPLETMYGNIDSKEMQADRATVGFSVSDIKGLQQNLSLKLNGFQLPIQLTTNTKNYESLLETNSFGANVKQAQSFELQIPIHGSGQLRFIPLGKNTQLMMNSPWAFPKFDGAFLPTERQLRNDGFSAQWSIAQFGKNLPTYTIETSNRSESLFRDQFDLSAFGADFEYPTDFYQKTTRSVKYGILFVVFTFLTFFLFEVLHRLKVHPFQYLLVGISLCIFYLLLLSFSEQIGFLPAYIIASISTAGLNTVYAIKVFNSKKRGFIVGGVLALLYAYLYFIINNTDYALLIGSVSVFFVTAFVMYLTRNIKWYEIREGQ